MNFKNIAVAALMACAAGLFAEDKVTEFDWCTVSAPDKVAPGQKFSVVVTPKAAAEGYKIGGDLHNATASSYLGFAAWGGAPKKVVVGQPLKFDYKMPKFVDEEQGAQTIFYMTKKGWNEAEKKAYCPVVLPLLDAKATENVKAEAAKVAAEATKAGEGEKIAEFDWCTVKYPEKVASGKKFTFYVTLKDVPEGLKICADLHKGTPDSWIGWYANLGAKKAVSGATVTFTGTMCKFEDEETGVQPQIFLTKGGWNDAQKKASCPVILPLVNQ